MGARNGAELTSATEIVNSLVALREGIPSSVTRITTLEIEGPWISRRSPTDQAETAHNESGRTTDQREGQ